MASDVTEKSPVIEQMYDRTKTKYLPGKNEKGDGQFVDWGTKLYQLELELSYKTNEIVVLQKKLQKFACELYPDGDTHKRSTVQNLRNQNDNLKKRMAAKERQVRLEQKRCRGLELELAKEKKITKKLKTQQTCNHKAIQTSPTNHEATQVKPSMIKPSTRTVTTQCSPTVVKVTNTTKVTSNDSSPNTSRAAVAWGPETQKTTRSRCVRTATRSPRSSLSNSIRKSKPESVTVENKVRVEVVPKEDNRERQARTVATQNAASSPANKYVPSKEGVKFATAMTIRENNERTRETDDPLEMSITQEFDKENSVKTVVQSNRDFEIKQKPILMSQNGQVTSSFEHTTLPERIQSASYELDSGRGSYVSGRGSPASMFRGSQTGNVKTSYRQILDGTSPPNSASSSDQVYERNIPDLMSSQSHHQRASPRKTDARFNTTAWEIYNRGPPRSYPGGMVPYYLFRRSNDHDLKSWAQEKPIFVHVSEIVMQR